MPDRATFWPLWAAAVVLPLLGFALSAFLAWQSVRNEALGRIGRTVDMLHEHALRSFEAQEALLTAIDARIEGLDWAAISTSEELHRFLVRLDDSTPFLAGFALVDPTGRLAMTSGREPPPLAPVDFTGREFVRAHREGTAAETFISEQFLSREQRPRFAMSRAAHGESAGSPPGVLAGVFSSDSFSRFYASVTESSDDRVALVRLDGALLARHPPTPAPIRFNAATPLMRALAAQGSDSGVFNAPSGVDGVPRLNAFRRIGTYPVVVLYGVGPATLDAALWRRLVPLAGMSAAAAALLLGLTALVRRATRREARALARAAAEAETARAEAEARTTAEQRLRQSERSAALGQVTAGVAHDMNNLVQAVMASAKLLERRAAVPEEVRRIAGMLAGAAARGQRVAHRMLAFGRPAAQAEGFQAAEALAGLEELLGGLLGSGVRLLVEVEGPLPEVRADRPEFETVLVNLVVNARDAMPGGGVVRVTARQAEEGPPGLRAGGPWVRVDVADGGLGMSEELLLRAGEPFFTTKPPGQGTGLGLLMARQFAERAGGALTIESRPGEGTTVTLWLPLGRPGALRAPEPAEGDQA